MKPQEISLLRNRIHMLELRLDQVTKIGADATLQANELKAWLIALLKRIGPQYIRMEDMEVVGHAKVETDESGNEVRVAPETMFLVEPVPEDEVITVAWLPEDERTLPAGPGMVRLSAGVIEEEVANPEAQA